MSFTFGAKPSEPDEDEPVRLAPFVVQAKSLANAGFGFKAKFRYHLIWAGIKELIVFEVGPRSDAYRAGLKVGDKILQIRNVKVDGMGIRELRQAFEAKTESGGVSLTIRSKDSDEARTIELQFNDGPEPLPKQKP